MESRLVVLVLAACIVAAAGDHDHIFAGNTTDIIKWILNKESQNLSKDI